MINEKYRITEDDAIFTTLLGAACGDITGSVYERRNIKRKIDIDEMISGGERFTDDTVMTCAVAEGIRRGLLLLPDDWICVPKAEHTIAREIIRSMQEYGREYPEAGYGASFMDWIFSIDPEPYGSFGNGSAMRVSFAGWAAQTLEEAEKLAEISASVTHDHEDGIKGAKVVAGIIFLLRNGADKNDVYRYAMSFYDVSFSLDEIRAEYGFDVSCKGSVPQAIRAFLEGKSFADVISNAISIGGDSDTIAAIAGSMAEVIYPMPNILYKKTVAKLDRFLKSSIMSSARFLAER